MLKEPEIVPLYFNKDNLLYFYQAGNLRTTCMRPKLHTAVRQEITTSGSGIE